MTDTNHIQTTEDGNVYCYKLRMVVGLTPKHLATQCQVCPYFRGDAQGAGIECYYYDGTNEPIEQIFTQSEVAELEARMNALGTDRLLSAVKGKRTKEIVTKQDQRMKFSVSRNGDEIGMLYFGDDLAAEITTQDEELESLFVQGIVNPIEVVDSDGGTIYASVGDDSFPDAMVAYLRSFNYELVDRS